MVKDRGGAQHTPTPWEVQDPMGADIGLWIVETGKQAYEWRCIALACQDGDDREPGDPAPIGSLEQAANAAFIVRACNSHTAMLEALDALLHLPTHSQGGAGVFVHSQDWGPVIAKARAALAEQGE